MAQESDMEKKSRTTKKNNSVKAQKQKQHREVEQKPKREEIQKVVDSICSVYKKCGGCQYIDTPYEEQLKIKQKYLNKLLSEYGNVSPIIGMKEPYYYRNKVHHVFSRDRKGNILAGTYESNSHRVVNIEKCMIEDEISQEIIGSVKKMLKSFKITTYDEDRDYGLLRHVLVRRGFTSGEIMVVLVLTSPILPSKNNFVKELRRIHPGITTVVINVNDKRTSMVLGERNITLYGPGFIKDELCGCRFRISPDSFYQVNPVQTEVLYNTAIEYAGLTGKETVIDAYCGVGTIGLVAAKKAGNVIGIELNKNAVKDAIINAKENGISNVRFIQGDAGEYMTTMQSQRQKAHVVFMDPPRSGSTEQFIDAVTGMGPDRVVYVSCGPDTLARDLKYFSKKGYKVKKIQPVDMFPFAEHVETVVLMTRTK